MNLRFGYYFFTRTSHAHTVLQSFLDRLSDYSSWLADDESKAREAREKRLGVKKLTYSQRPVCGWTLDSNNYSEMLDRRGKLLRRDGC